MSWRSVVFMLIISVAAGMIGAQVGVFRTLRDYPGPPAGALAGAAAIARTSITLSAAQESSLTAIDARHQPRLLQLRKAVAVALLTLSAAFEETSTNTAAVTLASERLKTCANALQDEAVSYLEDVRGILSAEQRKILDQSIDLRLKTIARGT